MPTPLEIANAPGARRGVVVYRPSAQPRPTRRTNAAPIRGATRASGQVDWDALKQKMLTSEAGQKRQQKAAQKEAENQAYDEAPWYKKGLGMVLGNPVVKTGLMPLNYLQTFGRAVTLGVEEAAENLPEWAQGPLASVVDTERTEADKRSNWEKLFAPGTDYGFGQLLDEDNPQWVNRIAGFAGDVALDPLTYASFGATKVAGQVERGAKLAEAASATSKLDEFADVAARAASAGDFDEVARASRLAAEQEAIARRATQAAENVPLNQVPIRQGRRAREQMVAELAQHRPQLLETHGQELARAAQRGFNTVDDPMLREALGLQAPSARILGARIPGSEKAVRAGAKAGGAIRAGLNKVPLLEPALAKFTPRGLEEASAVLSRGQQGDVLRAATTVRIQNLLRRGTAEMEGRGNKALTDLVREMKKMGGEQEIRTLFREAEASAEPNIINKFFGEKLPEMYEKIAGRPMGVSRDPNTYVPHMMTPQWKRFIRSLGDPELVEDLGFVGDDLLENSSYLGKARKLQPDEIGVPKDFDIGGRTITLTDGTVDELNEELARAFPEFKGKAYVDDPVKIGEAYINSIARQAGRDRALDALAESENPLVREVTGDLLESVEKRNEFLRQNPIVQRAKAGYRKGQRILPVQPKGDMPVTPHDAMFATTKHVDETNANRQALFNEGKQFVSDVGKDVSATRSTLVDNLKNIRTQLMEGLGKQAKEAEKKLELINTAMSRMDEEIRKIGPLTAENVDDVVAVQATLEAGIATTKANIKKIRDRYGSQISRDQKKIVRELEKVLRGLEEDRANIRVKYDQGSDAMKAEASKRLKELEAPVVAARKELEVAEKEAGVSAVAPERVQAANAYLRSGFATEDAFEAERQLYSDVLGIYRDEGIPIVRKVDGRISMESADQVQQGVAEARKVEPPRLEAAAEAGLPEAVATPDVAAAAPEAATPRVQPDLSKNAQQLLKTARKSVATAEGRLKRAQTALAEAQAQGLSPEQIRKIEYGIQTQQQRLTDAQNTLRFAEQQQPAAAAPAAPMPAGPTPPPEPGMVRLFRGEALAPEPGPGLPAWMEGQPELVARNAVEGRWYHPNFDVASTYPTNRDPGVGNRIRYVDVTPEEYAQFQQLDEATKALSRDPGEAVLPPEIAARSQEYVPPAAAAAPEPPAPTGKLVRQEDGTYRTDDGYVVTKTPQGWLVELEDVEDYGFHPTLKEARKEVEYQQEISAPSPSAAAPAAATVEPPVPEPPVPAPEAPAAAKQRITKRWTKKTTETTDIESGPEGWTVEPYEESFRGQMAHEAPGYLQWGQQGPRLPVAPINPIHEPYGPRLTRYVALHKTDTGLRSRTFATAREAKLAVEEHLRQQAAKETIPEYAARTERLMTGERLPDAAAGVQPGYVPEPGYLQPGQLGPHLPERPLGELPKRPGQGEAVEYAPTPEAQVVESLRQPPRPTVSTRSETFWNDFDRWKMAEARSKDPNLTDAERAAAKRQATSLGGAFTQTTGKHYNQYAAQRIITDDAEHQMMVAAHPKVKAAKEKLAIAERDAQNQIESMVYLKHHNPVTGDDEFARLPTGSSIGFTGEGERVPVLPTAPPPGGYLPDANRPASTVDEWRSNYSPGERAADREILDSSISMLLGPDARKEFENLDAQKALIQQRLDNAATNQADLDQIDAAVKRAYTDEVKAADDAVLEAKRNRIREEMNLKDEDAVGSQAAVDQAKRLEREAIDRQTQVRQTWMRADQELKRIMKDRQDYLDAQGAVTRTEQAFHAHTGDSSKFIPAARAAAKKGENPVHAAAATVGYELTTQTKNLIRDLIQADQRLALAEEGGLTFLTDVQVRDLQGQLNAIDVAKRDVINQQIPNSVRSGAEVVPQMTFDELRQQPGGRVESNLARFGDEGKTPPVPPALGTGRPELVERAFAESLAPTEPGQRTVWSIPEGGALQAREEVTGRRQYQPGTEYEAIGELRRKARSIDEGESGRLMRQEEENIAREMESKRAVAEADEAANTLKLQTERDDALLPLRDKVETYQTVNAAMKDKQTLIPQRDAARAQRKIIVDTKVTKKADLVTIADDIEKVAKQNPDLLDEGLAKTEAVLQDARNEAQRVTDADLSAQQVQGAIDRVARGDTKDIDVMLTTVGSNWRMLYEANGGKGTPLKAGDTIVQADLHRMFTNLYEIKKDPVWFGRTLNAFTNLFKTYATLTPGFHIRNALSAIFMNTTDGVPLKMQFEAATKWREYMKAPDSEAWLASQSQHWQDAFAAAHGSGAAGRFGEAGFAEVAESGRILDKLERLQRNKVTRWSQRVGTNVEGSVRLAMAHHSMGLGENVESAIQRINRIHFDYGEVSKLDENMKRLVPFWTFMSRNMPMQVSQMWTHPQAYLTYERFKNNFSAENEEYTPEYWTKAGAWNTGLKVPGFIPEKFGGGLPIYLSPDLGYTRLASDVKDYEDFLSGKRPGAVLSQANPIFTSPAEFMTRQDIFTGQKFEEGETVPMGGPLGWPVKALAMLAGQYEDGEVDAAFANSIRAINPLQDRSARLLPQLSGNDPEGVKRQLESWARTMAGAPVRTLTPKQQDNEYLRRYYDELDAMNRRREREQRKAG